MSHCGKVINYEDPGVPTRAGFPKHHSWGDGATIFPESSTRKAFREVQIYSLLLSSCVDRKGETRVVHSFSQTSAAGDVMTSRRRSTQRRGAKGAGKAMLVQNEKPGCLLEGCSHYPIQIPGMCVLASPGFSQHNSRRGAWLKVTNAQTNLAVMSLIGEDNQAWSENSVSESGVSDEKLRSSLANTHSLFKTLRL